MSLASLRAFGAVASASLILLSGCASYSRIAKYPAEGKPVDVQVAPMAVSTWTELPVGVYKDDAHRIIVSGHQKGMAFGMLFGVAGLMIAQEVNKTNAADRYGATLNTAGADLVAVSKELLPLAEAKNPLPPRVDGVRPQLVQISPYAVFTIQKDGTAQLVALLRADVPGPDGNSAWSARYFAPAPGKYKIEGDDGWMTNGRYTAGIRLALSEAMDLCLQDIEGRLKPVRGAKITGRFPLVNTELTVPGIVVSETPSTVTVRLEVGDAAVIAGTQLLDKGDYKFADAEVTDHSK